MKTKFYPYSLGLLFLLIISSCGESSPINADGEEISIEENSIEDLPPEIQELVDQSEVLPDFPLLSQLTASPSVVGPGDVITLSGDPKLYGEVTITHASTSEKLEFISGAGSFTVPTDALNGIYLVTLENEEGAIALGSFRVASAPGIWLNASGRFVGTDEFIKVTVTAYQVPLDVFAVFQSGVLVQEDIPEDEFEASDPFAIDGLSVQLVPSTSGELRLGGFPGVPLAEIVDQTLLLPAIFANRLQVFALSPEIAQLLAEGDYEALDAFDEEMPEGMQVLLSNIVSIQQCNEPGEVRGDLGGAGIIRAISLNGAFPATATETNSGPFSFQVSAGIVILLGESGDGLTYSALAPQLVNVPCGESVEVDFDSAPEAGLQPLAKPEKGMFKLAAPALPYRNMQSGGGGEICRSLYIPNVGGSAEEAPAFLSAWTSQMSGRLSRVSVMNASDINAMLSWAAKQQLLGTPEEDQIDIPAIGEAAGGDFLLRSSVSKIGENYYATWALLRTEDARVIYRTSNKSANPESFINLPAGLLDAAQKADICATIDPEEKALDLGESVQLEIEMTDLNGEAFDALEINLFGDGPECGDLEWTTKTFTGDTIMTNKYTANNSIPCTDILEFSGNTMSPSGFEIASFAEDTTTKITKPFLFRFNMTTALDGGADGGLIEFTWDGVFYADEEGNIKTYNSADEADASVGRFTSQDIICRVHENGVLTFQSEDLKPNATWDIEFGGILEVIEAGTETKPVTFINIEIAPVGDVSSWNYDSKPFPAECSVDTLEVWMKVFLKLIALQPQSLISESLSGNFFEFGGTLDQPLTITIPLEAPLSEYTITITSVTEMVTQP